MSDWLLEQIIKITGDKKSENFWKKAIKILGPGIVETELGELKSQILEGTFKNKYINNKGAYLTTLLKKQIHKIKRPKTIIKTSRTKTHFEKTQQDLFKRLMPVEVPEITGEPKKMPVPYSGKEVPWSTFIGYEFFTLSTNKKRSDKVLARFRSLDGVVTEVPLTRGKISPDSLEEFGIPTVQHMRVFAALKLLWAQKGSKYTEYSDGTIICYVTVTAKELAKALGWKYWYKLGKNDLRWLKDSIAKLKSMPYYLHLEDSDFTGLKGYYFYLIDSFEGIDIKKQGGVEARFKVSFSSTVSWQLYKNHAVARPKEMLYVRGELASLLWLYLEPNLRSHSEVCINLKKLINVLNLPKAYWHKHKSRRKIEFSKAVKEINNSKIADEKIMKINIKINKDKSDYKLSAYLKNPKQIETILV